MSDPLPCKLINGQLPLILGDLGAPLAGKQPFIALAHTDAAVALVDGSYEGEGDGVLEGGAGAGAGVGFEVWG